MRVLLVQELALSETHFTSVTDGDAALPMLPPAQCPPQVLLLQQQRPCAPPWPSCTPSVGASADTPTPTPYCHLPPARTSRQSCPAIPTCKAASGIGFRQLRDEMINLNSVVTHQQGCCRVTPSTARARCRSARLHPSASRPAWSPGWCRHTLAA